MAREVQCSDRRLRGAGVRGAALSWLLVWAACTPLLATDLFGPASVSVHVGSRPGAVHIADLTADGALDFAVANVESDSVSVALGDGAGRFRVLEELGVGDGPVAIASGDLDCDDRVDLVVAHENDRSVAVLLGDGSGGFALASETQLSAGPASIAVADLDGDGLPDIAVAGSPIGSVTVLSGDGLGGVAGATTYSVGGTPSAISAADLNLDGTSDLVVARKSASSMLVMLGDGTGGFTQRSIDGVGGQMSHVAGDVNGDGTPDLAVASSSTSGVRALLGTGDGDFEVLPGVRLSSGISSLAIGDFDLDGRDDLAVTYLDSHVVTVLRGDGLGDFVQSMDIGVGVRPLASQSADFDADGSPDLVVVNQGSDSASVLFGDGVGGLIGNESAYVGGSPVALLAADFGGVDANGQPVATDGVVDLAVALFTYDSVKVLIGDGTGQTSRVIEIDVGQNAFPSSLASADFDGDSTRDLVVAKLNTDNVAPTGPGGIQLFLGNDLGGFVPGAEVSVGEEPFSVVSEDFDLDGNPDLAVANAGSDSISLLWGDGAGGFADIDSIPVWPEPVSLAAGDFSGDGLPDIAVALTSGVGLVLGLGGREFADPQILVPGAEGAIPNAVAAATLDDDSALDLVVASGSSDTISILYGDGGGGFSAPQVFEVANNPRSIAVGDLNDDGRQDLVVGNELSDSVSIFLGRPGRTFQRLDDLDVGNSPLSVAIADLGSTTGSDLVVAGFFEGVVTILSNRLDLRVDVNGSNRVDGFDINQLSRLAAGRSGTESFPLPADVDLDGIVDGADLARVAVRFGDLLRTGSPLVATVAPQPQPPAENTVSLQPVGGTGDRLLLKAVIRTAEPVAAARFDITFDGEVLAFRNAVKGDFFCDSDDPASGDCVNAVYYVSSAEGRISVAVEQPIGVPDEVARPTPAALLTLELQGRSEGQTGLVFSPASGAGSPTLFDSDGAEVPVEFVSDAGVLVENDSAVPPRRLGVSAERVNFGSIEMGTTARRQIRLSNFGFSTLTILDVACSAAWFSVSFNEQVVIPPFGFVRLPVQFEPDAAGPFSGQLTVTSDDDRNGVVTVRLEGTGVAPR